MEELKSEEMEKTYPVPDGTEGLKLQVIDDPDHTRVTLQLGIRTLSLSIQGARDLALALRMAAARMDNLTKELKAYDKQVRIMNSNLKPKRKKTRGVKGATRK